MLAPKPPVSVAFTATHLGLLAEKAGKETAFPETYQSIRDIVVEALARDWDNSHVAPATGATPPANGAHIAIDVSGSYSATSRELLIWVSLAVSEEHHPGIIGRPWTVGNARLSEVASLEVGLTQALPELQADVARRTAAWIRDVKAEGERQ